MFALITRPFLVCPHHPSPDRGSRVCPSHPSARTRVPVWGFSSRPCSRAASRAAAAGRGRGAARGSGLEGGEAFGDCHGYEGSNGRLPTSTRSPMAGHQWPLTRRSNTATGTGAQAMVWASRAPWPCRACHRLRVWGYGACRCAAESLDARRSPTPPAARHTNISPPPTTHPHTHRHTNTVSAARRAGLTVERQCGRGRGGGCGGPDAAGR